MIYIFKKLDYSEIEARIADREEYERLSALIRLAAYRIGMGR